MFSSVAADLADLPQRLAECQADGCQAIALAAQRFAQHHLLQDDAFAYLHEVLVQLKLN